jgi:2-polyprenyl-6-methoxyphenol hydroxylase-like FAD-dependent oxidoreductase
MRQQHQSDSGRVKRDALADSIQDARRMVGREALDDHRLVSYANGQQHVVAGGAVQVFHERHRYRAKAVTTGGERGHFKQRETDCVAAKLVSLESSDRDQLANETKCRAHWSAGPGTQLSERERCAIETAQQSKSAVEHGLAGHGFPTANHFGVPHRANYAADWKSIPRRASESRTLCFRFDDERGGRVLSTPVLIAGGGPAGLASAAELAFHGIASVVVEPRAAISMDRPRAKTTSVRTMEHFRRWGIAGQVREAAALTPGWSDRVVFSTSVLGEVITSFSDVFGLGANTLRVSPELGQQIPQPVVEKVLREHLARTPLVTTLFGSSVSTIMETADGVTATIVDGHGNESLLDADYLLGCDGATSAVRKAIGINYVGSSDPRPNFNVLFRSSDIDPPMGNAVHYWIVGGDTPGVVGRLDLNDLWWLIASGVDDSDGIRRIPQIIADLVGRPIAHEVVSTDSWTARLLVAERFQSQRVFLVGESAHLNPPWGGHGFNTSVGDAVNIGWKLAAVLRGWASPTLLESYESERKPIAEQTIAIARENMRALPIDLASESGVSNTAAAIQQSKNSEFHSLGLVLGYRYSDSAPHDPVHYDPNSEAGSRLPHARFSDGTPLFDSLGAEFTLLAPVGADVATGRSQAAGLGGPLTVVEPPLDYPWGADTLLIRPDQHIAQCAATAADIDLRLALGYPTLSPEPIAT